MSSKKLPGPDLDKLFGRIGNFILKPFILINPWIYPYKTTKIKYHGNRSCYCNSGYRHRECCGPLNHEKGLTAYEVTKTHKRTQKETTYIKVITTHTPFLIDFERGDINPLNRDGKYHDSDPKTPR